MSKFTVTIPDEIEDLTPSIRRFIDAMIYKLNRNAHKGKWEDLNTHTAFERLIGEVDELHEAILKKDNSVETLLEAADVANFALILANIAVEREDETPNPESFKCKKVASVAKAS